MDLSVIICTYNRSDHLGNVLKSLAEQELSHDIEWDIVVVDNNSTDDTYEVTKAFSGSDGIPVHYVKEEKQGLSHARNRGIVESKGRCVAFTDDDAIADRRWVDALYGTFQNYRCHCAGGRIYLKTAQKMPSWLTEELSGFLGFLDYGETPFEVKEENIFGGNMAFTREILEKVGYFNPEFGRKATSLFGGEEIELLERIKRAGGKIVYQPAALVHHVIGREKLAKEYFRRVHYFSGLRNGRFYGTCQGRRFCGIPLFIYRQFLQSVLNYIKSPTVRMQMNVCWYIGFMKGCTERNNPGNQECGSNS